jgi:hypothetical protein
MPSVKIVAMKDRALSKAIEELAFSDHKIALVSGPRQCGKTTLAKMLLHDRAAGFYGNWDEIKFRRAWANDPSSLIPATEEDDIPLIVLDELHKDRRWKRNLKGVFDTLESPCDFLVTGSARLNVYVKGSDSLLGRHLAFRLHPFSLRELECPDVLAPDVMMEALFDRAIAQEESSRENLSDLLAYGPFPHPLLSQSIRKARLWRRNREQLVIREDLRDISRLPELGRIEMMTSLLPERVGSPFSLSAMGRHLETSVPTIKRWITYLKELYYLFELKPFTGRISRSLRREGKIYLWDYGAVPDQGARFENLVAGHLLKTCHFWTDTGEGDFELYYLRDKEKHEIDFLIVRDGNPWLPVEVKSSSLSPSPHWRKFIPQLRCQHGLQIVNQPAWTFHEAGDSAILVAGAAEALRYFA